MYTGVGIMQLPLDTTTVAGRILAAAAVVFAERGVDQPSVEDILRRADVSRRTFYKHFTNREDVLVKLHHALSERFLAATAAVSADARAPEEHVERTVDLFLMAATRGGALFR